MISKIDSRLSKSEYNRRYYAANKPYPIRLGELKIKLQQDAFENDKSIPDVLRKIVKEYFDRKEMEKSLKEIMKPLSELKWKIWNFYTSSFIMQVQSILDISLGG